MAKKLFFLVGILIFAMVSVANAFPPTAPTTSTLSSTDTANFDGNLDSNDDTVQKALDTLDEVAGVGDSTETNQDDAWDVLTGTQTFITVTYQDATNDVDFVVPVLDEDDMATDSAVHLATQQSIKAYVDTSGAQRTQEEIEDFAGGMWTGNTETYIAITYQDGDGTIDAVVDQAAIVAAISWGGDLTSSGSTPQVVEANVDHDSLANFVANEHLDWTSDLGATNIHVNNIDLSAVYEPIGVTESDIGDLGTTVYLKTALDSSAEIVAVAGWAANVASILDAANYAAIKTLLDTDDIQTLTGIAAGTAHLGDFDEAIITSDITIKAALQELETHIDGLGGGHPSVTIAGGITGLTLSTQELSLHAYIEDIAEFTDPNADRIIFFDDTAGVMTGLVPVANVLSISGTNLTLADHDDARTALGLAIGSDTQAWDDDLDTYASITPSANVQTLLANATFALMRADLDLEAGTDFYAMAAADAAFEAELDNSAGLLAALSDETGTGVAVFGTNPTLTGFALAGAITAISTTDEFQATAGQNIVFQLGDNAGSNKFSVQDSDSAEIWSVNSNGIVTAIAVLNPYVAFPEISATDWWIGGYDTGVDRFELRQNVAVNTNVVVYWDINEQVLAGHMNLTTGHTYQINSTQIALTNLSDGLSHAANHVNAGADDLDGDLLDIDYAETNYTPATTGVATDVNDLAAHLEGIDDALGALGAGTIAGLTDTVGVDYTGGTILIGDDTNSMDQKVIGGHATLAADGTLTLAANVPLTGSPTVATSIDPDTADGATIGSATKEWSDLYLAASGVIYGENDQSNTLTSGAAGWSMNLDLTVLGELELGHATDTTIARVSAGVLSVEGVQLASAGISTVTDANGFTMSAAQCLAGVVAYATGAGTIVMCPVLSTSSFTVVDYGGAAVVLNPDASGTEDTIILDGTILAQGDGVTSTSTTGDMIVCTYQAADIWYCASGSPDGDHWTDTN